MPFNMDIGDPFKWVPNSSLTPFVTTTGLTEVSPALDVGRHFIGLIYGQSLAGSHIPASYTVTNPTKVRMVNWAGDRKLYQHKEPMLGASYFSAGESNSNVVWNFPYTSLWGKVGDILINASAFDLVTWINYSSGGSQISAFEPGGLFTAHTPTVFHVLRMLGYSGNMVTAGISMIGESDGAAGTIAENFKQRTRNLIRVWRSFGFTGPVFIPKETWRGMGPGTGTVESTIQQAQVDLWSEAGFAQGPDFDTLGLAYRDANGTHEGGHDPWAQMWARVIMAKFG